jgi:hypothetical protein
MKLTEFTKFDKRFLMVIPIVTVPAFLFTSVMIFVGLIALTLVVSYIAAKTQLKKLGLELVTFTTVIAGVSYGIVPGMITGAVLILTHDIITHRVSTYLLWVVPVFGLMGAIASVFASADIVMLGVGLAMLAHIVFLTGQTLTSKFPVTYVPYFAVNVVLNFFLFSNFAGHIISAL